MLTRGDIPKGRKKVAFGKKKAAPFASAKSDPGKAKVKRKAASTKTAKGTSKRRSK